MAETRSKPRGELAELSAQLQNLCTAGKRTERELRNAKKDVFRKVVNYMTLGMDMSALFPMMTSCANLSADDLVLKKMLYLYLTHYASQTPDLALLTINQLQKDCADHDPMIRGLALRSLCSLRVANFLEYVVTPIMTGLSDRHPYVRRTAVMGVLKVHHIDTNAVAQHGMVERVKRLLSVDTDVQVIANCLSVLMQLEPPGRLAEKALVYSLLNRIKEFSDWGQCQVLELVTHYTPSSEAEVYDMLNALEDRMGHVNSAVVMATIKVFLGLTLNMTATHQQVLERIREPLKTLISRDDAPTAYAALSHVLLLAQRAPMIFEGDAVAFFCRAHDPWFVKKLKLEILAAIASTANVYDIVTELTEYARDISPTMAREAVRAVGRIALAVPDSGGIVERLLMFLDGSSSEYLVAEALVQLGDVLRRYPDVAHVALGGGDGGGSGSGLADLAVHANISEPAARAAFVWILGQFGGLVQDAPYLLEPFVEGFASEDASVRLAVLTAAVQLFFRRPPEMKPILGAALAAGVADSHADVHDRALMYYRLLRTDVAAAERVVAPPLVVVPWFSEALSPEAKDAIFAEFNSLSVVFQQPAAAFIERQAYHSLEAEPEPPSQAPTTDLLALEAPELLGADRATNLLADADGADLVGSSLGADLLDLDIGGGGGGGPGGASTITSTAVPAGGYGAGPQHQTQWQPQPAAVDLLGGLGGDMMAPRQPQQQQQQLVGGPAPWPTPGGMQQVPAGHMGGISVQAAPVLGSGGGPQGIQIPSQGNLLALAEDGLGLGLGPAAASAAPALPAPAQELVLNSKARVTPAAFQEEWKRLPPAHSGTLSVSPATVAAITANNHRDFTQHMTQAYIHTIASGGQAPSFRYYFYGQNAGPSGALYLVELLLRSDSGNMTVTVKTGDTSALPAFLELWNACLTGFLVMG
ncbi:hypothetical protein PLESTB_000752500 [Pleodorina starrii]|uniref:Beta-adaptin appendage C-terminal subdomain domain-containing protein n=1 Tax=Pleodorina starrii TaxID=330485 RepID=A0A9W6BJR2_9CHLO|nr:hypothetical protein PLESTM_001567800 [Pleodorina starrii]GLC53462.1 hypothetical protein PLESTB_000752500 [Pleodorina starrii]GLC69805.1 hypothetical protein PLESTF_000882400 [Pleodorina starrii]